MSVFSSKAMASVFLLASMVVSWETALAAAGRPSAATLKHLYDNCHAHANLDACYDAVRWSPSDPAVLVALGDAQVAATRFADALRTYRRAAELAPATRGLAAKISATEAKLSPKHARNPLPHAADRGAAEKRFSNAAPEAQSH